MTVVTQQNLRSLLPGKIAQVAVLIAADTRCSLKEALLQFYRSPVYKELEIEQTKRWWQSPLELYEDM